MVTLRKEKSLKAEALIHSRAFSIHPRALPVFSWPGAIPVPCIPEASLTALETGFSQEKLSTGTGILQSASSLHTKLFPSHCNSVSRFAFPGADELPHKGVVRLN